jgi:hypothetical protein
MRPAPNWQKLIMPALSIMLRVTHQSRAVGPGMTTIRLTMAQALTRHLAVQTSEVDGREVPLFAERFLRFSGTAMSPELAKRCTTRASGCQPVATR